MVATAEELKELALLAREAGDEELEANALEQLVTIQEAATTRVGTPQDLRKQAYADLAADTSLGETILVGMGRGFMTIPRALGIVQEDQGTRQAMEALEAESPIAFGAGELVGEAAPFAGLGAGIGAIPTVGGRVLASTALGAVEGATIAGAEPDATIEEVTQAAGIGGAIGLGAEVLFPVLGRLGRSVFQRVRGKPPVGAMLDAAGKPTMELREALTEVGMSMDDLTADAMEYIGQQTGRDPRQVARAAQAVQEGIPLSKGELTQEFAQQATEQRLFRSSTDPIANKFRQFKLQQSDAIRDALTRSIDDTALPEQTGTAIKDALTGRKKLLRTQKNELYQEAAEAAKEVGGIPIFTSALEQSLPDMRTLKRTDRISKGAVGDAMELLAEYGVIDPTEEMLGRGIMPSEVLSLENFDDFRQTLGMIERGDPSGAASVVIGPLRQALDQEVDVLAETLTAKGFNGEVVEPLKKARKILRELKTEFSPQAMAGKLVNVNRDGVTPVIEASKAYSQLVGKAQPVENTRRVLNNLSKSGTAGKQAVADIQATTIMDLVDAGFGTASRKVDGVPVFNPVAFKRRLKSIGQDKVNAIFRGNPDILRSIRNIDNISKDMIPAEGATPMGSATVILDLMDKLSVIGIAQKIPGGGLLLEQIQQLAESRAGRKAVADAMEATPRALAPPQIERIVSETFPGIAGAIAVGASAKQEQTPQSNQINR